MIKPVVHYYPSHDDHIVLGRSAIIAPIDHPDEANVSNQTIVRTSHVVVIRDDGSFETENTIYEPIKD